MHGTSASQVRAQITVSQRQCRRSCTTPRTQAAFSLPCIRNQTANDQIRIDAQFRQDFFQIPYDPSSTDYECNNRTTITPTASATAKRERDSFVIATGFTRCHLKRPLLSRLSTTSTRRTTIRRHTDLPVATTWHQTSNYAAAQADTARRHRPQQLLRRLSTLLSAERDLFGTHRSTTIAPRPRVPNTQPTSNAALYEFYFADHLRLGRYITLSAASASPVYHAGIDETAIYPRIGATVEIPAPALDLPRLLRPFLPAGPRPDRLFGSVLNYVQSSAPRRTKHIHAAALRAR